MPRPRPSATGAELATFDTAEEVWDQRASVLFAAVGMPPHAAERGTTDIQRMKLAIWMECGTYGE